MPIVKNDEDCCVYRAPKESGVILNDTECVTECNTAPKDTCGGTHPVGSGTIAGCNSTTLPHFGVVMGKREGNCVPFGYYTSGNVNDYENLCGDIEDLCCEEVVETCITSVVYSSECRVPCPDKVVTQDELDAVVAAQAAIDTVQNQNLEEEVAAQALIDAAQDQSMQDALDAQAAIDAAQDQNAQDAATAQAATDAAQDESIAANVDNTDTGTIVIEDGVVYTVLEDGAKVPQAQAVNIDGTLAGVVIGG